jgi:NAD(P)-dependent dehydrogenase (short-subunit alcohol dehydrogenase family)
VGHHRADIRNWPSHRARLAKHGTVVLVGRDPAKLSAVRAEIEALPDGRPVSVVCDFSDVTSALRAAAEIVAHELPLAGVLNNAGIMSSRDERSPQGWDLSFATNHLGPFAFTEALIPALPDGANVVFVCSAVEDPACKPAVTAGLRGGRYLSAEASARGEWEPGGSSKPGFDADATSKQCNLATVLASARETPRLRFNAVEPGFNPGTGLGRDANAVLRLLAKYVLTPLAPLIKYWSTPKRAARVITEVRHVEPDRDLLRRERRTDGRLHPGERPGLRRPDRRRDARAARPLQPVSGVAADARSSRTVCTICLNSGSSRSWNGAWGALKVIDRTPNGVLSSAVTTSSDSDPWASGPPRTVRSSRLSVPW